MNKHEKRFLRKNKDLKPTKNSGQTYNDADFRLCDKWLVEAKNHPSNKSISFSNDNWKKLRKQALLRGRRPLVMFSNLEANVVIMDEEDFKEMYEENINEKENREG